VPSVLSAPCLGERRGCHGGEVDGVAQLANAAKAGVRGRGQDLRTVIASASVQPTLGRWTYLRPSSRFMA
jgi:hypothetical protein